VVQKVVPMIHVPDVQATVDWYHDIGFAIVETHGHEGEGLSFAIVSFGDTEVMFSEGGRPSTQRRREVDLYVYTHDIDDLYDRLKDRVEVVEGPHDMFYGMREFIIRDLNRFWITFGQTSAFGILMTGIREADVEIVQSALKSGGLSPHSLTTAVWVASSGSKENAEILNLLMKAGAVPPPNIDVNIFGGHYKSGRLDVEMVIEDDRLLAVPSGGRPISLMPVGQNVFKPIHSQDVTVTFKVEDRSVGFTLTQGTQTTYLERVD
jgi:uncharacterized glyoxalase superfamily protein PhnB